MEGYVLGYINENEFKKLERSLKKYNMLAYKKLNFEFYPALRKGEFLGNLIGKSEKAGTESYELKLPGDSIFSQVHGDVKLIYTVYVNEQTIMLNTITPSDILLEGHKSELTTYKGIVISKQNASKDMFKIDSLKALVSDDCKEQAFVKNLDNTSVLYSIYLKNIRDKASYLLSCADIYKIVDIENVGWLQRYIPNNPSDEESVRSIIAFFGIVFSLACFPCIIMLPVVGIAFAIIGFSLLGYLFATIKSFAKRKSEFYFKCNIYSEILSLSEEYKSFKNK